MWQHCAYLSNHPLNRTNLFWQLPCTHLTKLRVLLKQEAINVIELCASLFTRHHDPDVRRWVAPLQPNRRSRLFAILCMCMLVMRIHCTCCLQDAPRVLFPWNSLWTPSRDQRRVNRNRFRKMMRWLFCIAICEGWWKYFCFLFLRHKNYGMMGEKEIITISAVLSWL